MASILGRVECQPLGINPCRYILFYFFHFQKRSFRESVDVDPMRNIPAPARE